MAAPPLAQEQTKDKWGFGDDPDNMGPMSSTNLLVDDAPLAADETTSGQQAGTSGHKRTSSGDNGVPGSKTDSSREKTFKTNKVYIGGLPDHTRQEDLQSCFGKIGRIIHIELKIGYGFVEFESREAADESVAKYNEGYFMGNKIRVELSHGRGRATRRSDDPGACFRCGETGHWARECPRLQTLPRGSPHDAGLIDRFHPPRDYLPPPREYGPPGGYPPQDAKYYDYPPPPPPPPAGRDFRRPLSPMRDRRDYPVGPPPRPRDYDDYRMRAPPPPPPSRYDRPYDREPPRGYPPPRDDDRYERRPPDRYPPSQSRPRTPPGPPRREDYDRPPRDYIPADTTSRARLLTPPPRPLEYRRSHSPEQLRYRRRSPSPPPRSAHYDAYSGANGYSGDRSAPVRDDKRVRDYPPHRDGPEVGYRRP